jgi:surfactin synthase thioesterase subunit
MRHKMFCLPFAGGNKYSYEKYVQASPRNIEMIPIELPGRGSRWGEVLLRSTDAIVHEVYTQVRSHLESPYLIFGHSMGALVGYLLAKQIIAHQLPGPVCCFFSGCKGPSVFKAGNNWHTLPYQAFVDKITELGGLPDKESVRNEILSCYEPILRADFEAIGGYCYQHSEPLDVPIYLMMGTQEKTSFQDVLAWQIESKRKIEVTYFPGNHFFIFQHHREIISLFETKLKLLMGKETTEFNPTRYNIKL